MAKKLSRFLPVIVAVLLGLGFAAWRLAEADGDPLALAEIGTRFSQADPEGTEGYDGQFVYYIARDPDPSTVAPYLDNAPYRYQRILYPLLARAVALGRQELIPWTLLILNLAAHGLGTYGFTVLLRKFHQPIRYALIYGGWVGLIAPIGLDMPEPLAFSLAIFSILSFLEGRGFISALLVTAAVFTREAMLPFLGAMLVAAMFKRERSTSFWMAAGLIAFGAFQFWLKAAFGDFGLGTGGAGDSGMEWVPLLGLLRIAEESLPALGAYLLVFGPSIVIPAIWGIMASSVSLRRRSGGLESWLLLLNCLVVLFLPYSTFREPLALVRLGTGMIVSLALFAAKENLSRPLNYGMFWMAMLVLIIQ
jgi:hypothetical protein